MEHFKISKVMKTSNTSKRYFALFIKKIPQSPNNTADVRQKVLEMQTELTK